MDAFGGGLGTILSLGNSGLFKYVESGYLNGTTTYTFARAQTIVFVSSHYSGSNTTNTAIATFICPSGSLRGVGSEETTTGGAVSPVSHGISLDSTGKILSCNNNRIDSNFIGFAV